MKRRLIRVSLVLLCLFYSSTESASALDGRVLDATTGAAVPGATVTVGQDVLQTSAAGTFQISGTEARVMVRAPGYRAAEMPIGDVVKSGGIVRLTPFEPKALYLTIYGVGSRVLRESALQLIKQTQLNALVIDLKGDRGLIDYPSALPLAKAAGARSLTTIPDLKALVRQLHEAGIYAIARIVVFKDNPLANARPDLAVKRGGALFRDREKLAWTDPFRQEVRDYNIGVAVEAAQAGFDEIQFDYLRFPDSSQSLQFAQAPTQQARVEAIGRFLAEARRRLAPYNVYLAVDYFGYVCWNQNDTGIGQRLPELASDVDYLSPMLYPSGFQFGIPGYRNPVTHVYEIVRLSLDQARRRLGVAPNRFRPWLQAFKDYAFDRRVFDADEVKAQIRAASEFGSDGWMLWNARNEYGGIGIASREAPAGRDAAKAFGSSGISGSDACS